MLPSHHRQSIASASTQPELKKFTIQTSDVLQDLKVCVNEEGSDTVIWYKERFLTDDEIVDNVIENATATIKWTIHRPKRGWYLRIQSPDLPSLFTSLADVPTSSSWHADGALWFPYRTVASPLYETSSSPQEGTLDSAKSSLETVLSSTETAVAHSYPPSPPPAAHLINATISPSAIHARLQASSSAQDTSASSTQMTHFCVSPHSTPHAEQPPNRSFLTKALSLFQNNKPSHAASFTLYPIPRTSTGSTVQPHSSWHLTTPPALLTFHDRTPTFTFRSTTGLLEINTELERQFGVDRSFWIAVGLAYMDFLEEREGYLAAASD